MRDSFLKTVLVALVLCVVGSLFVSVFAAGLHERQEENKAADKKKNVLVAAQLFDLTKKMSDQEKKKQITEAFKNVKKVVIDRETGEITSDDPETFNEEAALKAKDAKWYTAREADGKPIKVPAKVVIYQVFENGQLKSFIFPIFGKGLWDNMQGFICLDAHAKTVVGMTYYEQAETAGLGAEVTNPKWRKLWEGRKIYGENDQVEFKIIKGYAGTVEKDPYHVDGLSGSTLTGNGVTTMVRFWFGKYGYLNFLKKHAV